MYKREILFYMEYLGLLLIFNIERLNFKKIFWYYIFSMNIRIFDKNNRGYKKFLIFCFKFEEKG